MMRIKSLTIAGMWCFGSEPAHFTGLGQHNTLIGKNNAGKSKVLAAIRWIAENRERLIQTKPFAPGGYVLHKADRDKPQGSPVRLEMELEADVELQKAVREALEA